MKVTEVSAAEYGGLFGEASHVFNSVAFAELNRHKATSLRYLCFGDAKVRFGLTLGEKAGGLCTPFSAPFGGFEVRGVQRLAYMEDAVSSLKDYVRSDASLPSRQVMVTLPPLVYGETQLSKWVNVMQRCGTLARIDLNYHFDLSRFPRYESVIERNARKNLRHALAEDLKLMKLDSTRTGDIARAYEVIRQNREEHGYPLRMSLQDVEDTVKVIRADFFVMTHGGVDVAAAQVFHVAKGVAQVVYWGDLRAYSHLRTMNSLAYMLFAYYHATGLKVLDIGPSTEGGVPNHGLCEFKEGIGCSVTPKFSFML